GLVAGPSGAPAFCGDAIADPLTGIHAAHALLQSRSRGGGEIVEIAMSAVAASYAQLDHGDQKSCTTAPLLTSRASPLGSDNVLVDRLVAQRLVASC
ncbi:MAG: CoA transferase, partial [Mycobacterium sp.]